MKKFACLCLCLFPLLFSGCATMKIISTVVAVSDGLSGKEKKKADPEEILAKVVTSEKVVSSVQNALEDISPEKEYIIGRAVASSALGTYSLYENPVVTSYVNKICAVLVANSSNPYLYKGYFVAVLDTDEINALSTPGGHILITKGLLKCAESEDALAAVIAHEVAHIQLNHPIEAIRTSRVITAATDVMSEVQSVDREYTNDILKKFEETRTEIYKTLIQTGFSKSQEFDADSYAMDLMNMAGYDPNCMIDLLTILEKNTTTTGWIKTHPKPEERIKKASKKFIFAKGESSSVRQARFDSVKATL